MSSRSRLVTTDVDRNFRAIINGSPFINSIQDLQEAGGLPLASVAQDIMERKGYASPIMAQTGSGLIKTASSGIVYTQPQFFSPIHTPINWQIPSKRKEQYQWARFYYENEPKVATSLDFYSKFPVNDYKHVCKNRYVKKFYADLDKKLETIRWLRIISHESHLLGDCFPFVEIECERCGGAGVVDGEVCDHEGGSFKRLVILNPEYVEVYSSPIAPDPMIAFLPSEELRNIVSKRGPGYEDRKSVV